MRAELDKNNAGTGGLFGSGKYAIVPCNTPEELFRRYGKDVGERVIALQEQQKISINSALNQYLGSRHDRALSGQDAALVAEIDCEPNPDAWE